MTEDAYYLILQEHPFDLMYEANGYLIVLRDSQSNDNIGFDYSIYTADKGRELDGGFILDETMNVRNALLYLSRNIIGCSLGDMKKRSTYRLPSHPYSYQSRH